MLVRLAEGHARVVVAREGAQQEDHLHHDALHRDVVVEGVKGEVDQAGLDKGLAVALVHEAAEARRLERGLLDSG